jgi:hypothetical protein
VGTKEREVATCGRLHVILRLATGLPHPGGSIGKRVYRQVVKRKRDRAGEHIVMYFQHPDFFVEPARLANEKIPIGEENKRRAFEVHLPALQHGLQRIVGDVPIEQEVARNRAAVQKTRNERLQFRIGARTSVFDHHDLEPVLVHGK